MVKLSIAIFFLLFTLSFARTPLTQQENDIKLPHTLPEHDATPTNQLDKETHHVQDNQDLPEPKAKKIKALPLTFVRLRPINRHFRARSSRLPNRLCHHHFHHAHNLKPRTHHDDHDQINDNNPVKSHRWSLGKDMILSSGDNSDFDDHVMFDGGMHQVPEEWMSFLHDNNEDDDEQKMSRFIIKRDNHDKFAKLKLKNQFYDPFDDEEEEEDEDDKISAMQYDDHNSIARKKLKKHLHHHHEEEEQEAEEENEVHKEEKKTGGLVKHIRKFLDHYFD